MVFWKAPGFSVGTVKPVNMIDEERDACPALLALYHPFVRYAHFLYFSRKITLIVFSNLAWFSQLHHGFAGAYSAANFSGLVRGSMVGYSLASSLLQHVLTRLSRGFTEEYSRRRFLFVHLCSIAFLIGTNGMFSPLCRRFTFVSARSFEAEKIVAQVGVVGDIAARHIGDGGALVLVNAHDRRCSPKTYRRGHLFIFHDGLYNPDG